MRIWSLICLGALIAAPLAARAAVPRSEIFFVADGLGWGHLGTWLEVRRQEGRPPKMAALWEKGRTGVMTLRPLDAVVPESAGGASMLATGAPMANRALAMTPDGSRPPLLLERARAAGKSTGLITLGRLTHAIPAAFLVHARSRDPESALPAALLAGPAQLLFAGGRDVFAEQLDPARAAGWRVIGGEEELAPDLPLPVLGLFTPDYFPYALDRSTGSPTLETMTRAAVAILGRNPKGFVLVIDARLIDESSHNNDAASMLSEMDELDDAVGAALEQAPARKALIVLTSPHDTGGPAVVSRANPLEWVDPAQLGAVRGQRGSFRRVLARLWDRERSGRPVDAAAVREDSKDLIPALAALDDEALSVVARAYAEGPKSRPYAHAPACQEMAHALETSYSIRWLTGAHSNAPVPLFALGPGAERFGGWPGADAVGRALASVLGL
jgi:alkaline phosphatase